MDVFTINSMCAINTAYEPQKGVGFEMGVITFPVKYFQNDRRKFVKNSKTHTALSNSKPEIQARPQNSEEEKTKENS